LLDKLLATDICAAPVQDFEEVVHDPQANHNGLFIDVDHPEAGTLKLVGHPANLSATPGTVRYPPPRVGEHTDEVLSELGVDKARIEALRSKGEIGRASCR